MLATALLQATSRTVSSRVMTAQVAEELLNPFGEDDDNFEINSLIDSLLKVPSLCPSLPMSVRLSACLAECVRLR